MPAKDEKISAKVTSLSPSKREMEIEVGVDEVASEWEKVLDSYVSRARLDGFRRGKAPRDLVGRLFYKDIRNDVIESLVPRALGETLAKENLNPVITPIVSEVLFRDGEPFRFKVSVEVFPEFKLQSYKNIRVKKREVKVEDADVDRALEELRQKSAEYIPVEGRGVLEGDYVLMEWKGKDLTTKKALPTEKVLVLAGHPDNDKALNENLFGLKPQETRRFVISYPQDHPQKKLAGRTLEYEIKLISIKEKKVPEMTDEWAKDLGGFETLSSLREGVRKDLEGVREGAARREMGEEILETIAQQMALELPESLVEREAGELIKSWTSAKSDTVTLENVEALRQKARVKAEKNITNGLVLRKIAAEEGLEVTDEEIEEEIRVMARRNNIPLAQFVDSLNREGKREDVKANLLLRKAIDFLLEKAVLY
ncbi:MAG: trigger factor [Clostridiales bacterium]|nr:trigger factor [Clostridiales bacterium]